MNWGEFKKKVEDGNINDGTEIAYIDIGNSENIDIEAWDHGNAPMFSVTD